MKKKLILMAVIFQVILVSAYPQEKSKKELKEEERQQKQQQIETLMNSKDFIFVARYALPMGRRQIDMTSNPNYVKFNPEQFDGYMPYFGEATAGIGYSGDPTIKFRDKPESYTIEKKKKNFQVDAKVKGENDIYRLSLSVTFEGSASLSVISNHRSTISYQGEVMPEGSWKSRK